MKHGDYTMDEMDKILISNLEKDARMSLKKLAQQMGMKISTLYHRLHKLSESKTIINFSIIVNPEKIGIKEFYKLAVTLNLPDDPISRKLSENLSDKLSKDLKEVFFSALSDSNTLHMIVAFFSEEHKNEFLNILSTNEMVKNIEKVQLQFIHKGLRMFDFNDDILLNLIQSRNKKSFKDSEHSEQDNLGEIVDLDDDSFKEITKINTKTEKKDTDGMIPL